MRDDSVRSIQTRLFLLLFFNLHRILGAVRSPAKNRTAKGQFYFALLPKYLVRPQIVTSLIGQK